MRPLIALRWCSATYPNAGACLAACSALPDMGSYSDTIQSGDSVQCRLYFASAATIDPSIQCPHADIGRAGHCGPAR